MKNHDHAPIPLALSPRGQVALCRGCLQGITVEFGPIMQLFSREDFLRLEYNLRYMCPAEYFKNYPGRPKIILNTPSPDLYFAFTEKEFLELQKLLHNSLCKLQLIEATEKNVN